MPIGDILAQITGAPSPSETSFPAPPKRKAEDDLRRPVQRTSNTSTQTANSSRPISDVRRPPGPDMKKPVQNGSSQSNVSHGSTTFKHGQPTPPPANASKHVEAPPPATSGPTKPPKKGSFAEIMARGKANQSTLGQVGKIQHKKVEKPISMRERAALKGQKSKNIEHGLKPNSKFSKMGSPAVPTAKPSPKKSVKDAVPEKKVKKAALATTGYSGTARPRPGASGPSKGASSSSRDRHTDLKRSKASFAARRNEYLGTDDEEEEDDDLEDEGDYASDASSDMEAAVFEVDEEEELAARIARKEDAEALLEENRLKREKEEKKRRLAMLAKRAPAPRY